MSESTVNEAVSAADDDAKARALAILEGRDESLSCPPESDADPASDLGPPSSEEAPLLLGMGESARLLGVSRATLWRMIREGSLEKVELYHNSCRLHRADIMELARAHTAPRWRARKKEQAD